MDGKLLLFIMAILMAATLFTPVTNTTTYEEVEEYQENYTVIEPRDVKVADWVVSAVNVTEPFQEARLKPIDLKFSLVLNRCDKDISYKKEDFAYRKWGKYKVIRHGEGTYFAGYEKGDISEKSVNTYDTDSKTGHVYSVLINDNIIRTLKEGEHLTLQGFSMQVNSFGETTKSDKECTATSHYYDPEDTEDYTPRRECVTVSTEFYGARLTLSDNNVVKQWDAEGGDTLVYSRTLTGGETVPLIAIHVANVSDGNITIDGVFQISKDDARLYDLGSEITVTITNTDVVTGNFGLYEGFIMENSTGIGRFASVSLKPSESGSFTFTTDKEVEDCKYYGYSISKKQVPENFTNYRESVAYNRTTSYRNVTLYVDVTKTKPAYRNITVTKKEKILLIQKLLSGKLLLPIFP